MKPAEIPVVYGDDPESITTSWDAMRSTSPVPVRTSALPVSVRSPPLPAFVASGLALARSAPATKRSDDDGVVDNELLGSTPSEIVPLTVIDPVARTARS